MVSGFKLDVNSEHHKISEDQENFNCLSVLLIEVKAIPLQALTGPEGFRRSRLPGFKKIGT
jgi:hypothetical protein